MDISEMNNTYNDFLISSSAQSASASGLNDRLNTDFSKADDEELMDACKQFESYFLEKVFQEMQKTVKPDGDPGTGNGLVDFFKDRTVQQIAADSTEQNSLGLAQMLYEQMRRNYGLEDEE